MSRAIRARMKRIEQGRFKREVRIVPPSGQEPTPEGIAALRADLAALVKNPKAIIITRESPRLDQWGVRDLVEQFRRTIIIERSYLQAGRP